MALALASVDVAATTPIDAINLLFSVAAARALSPQPRPQPRGRLMYFTHFPYIGSRQAPPLRDASPCCRPT